MPKEEAPSTAAVHISWTPAHAVVAIEGKFGVEYAGAIGEQLRAVVLGGHWYVLVDLAGVTEIDSHGLAALITLVKMARERGGAVRCCGATSAVYGVFELTRLHRILDFFPDRAAALVPPWDTPVAGSG